MMGRLQNDIRRAIRQSGQSRYRIALGAGVDHATMSRFINRKRDLTLDSIMRILDYLGMELTIRPKGKAKKGR